MRIWILSDLHIPQKDAIRLIKPDRYPQADVCVLAGDVTDSMHLAINWVGKVVRPKMPVIWVPGNHEFYDTSIESGRKNARLIANALDVTFLDNGVEIIEGVRFLGGTLWTDFAIDAPEAGAERNVAIQKAMWAAKNGLSDYSNIYLKAPKGDGIIPRLALPSDFVTLHQETRSFIDVTLAVPFDGKTVVVSHHAPHRASIHPKFEGDATNGAFVSDLSDLIEEHQPNLWVHGHVHQPFDYHVGNTRVICNPRGYGAENEKFEFGKVIEL
jgi:Icc-related predicted phosphoesterase